MNSKSILKIIVGIVLLVALVGWLVQFLWNHLMTEIFNLPFISIWQAYGLLLLSKILFGGGGAFKNKWKNSCSESMRNKLESMSPEEKERCRMQWEKRCGKWKDSE
ncbi:MAG: hypothetical protein IPK10_19690 [Bacteroidetes bacterium]|nr:hypothetical protein [Bacteroidota bacterium]